MKPTTLEINDDVIVSVIKYKGRVYLKSSNIDLSTKEGIGKAMEEARRLGAMVERTIWFDPDLGNQQEIYYDDILQLKST